MTDIIDFKLQNNSCLWYHELNSDNWTIESYKMIMEIKTFHNLCSHIYLT